MATRLQGEGRGRVKTTLLVQMLVLLASFCLSSYGAEDPLPPPCNPQPVVKPVKVVRREIKVAIVGEDRMFKPKDLKWDVQAVIDYWYEAMDREIGNSPDLVILPEGIDNWRDVTPAEKREWVKVRGDRIFRAMQDYARKHRCYLVFNSPRQFPDGRFANTSWTLDRDGDLVASYDKAYPTPREMEWEDFKNVPGDRPVVCDTDFGRLGFVTCFDLNFTHFADEYRPLAPDVMVFCSYYDGNYMRNYWASRVQAYLIGCTVGGDLPKTVVGPSGEDLLYFPEGRPGHRKTTTVTINTNFRVIHYDGNKPKLAAALEKYGARVYITDPTRAGTFTLYSADPTLPVDDVVKEFGMETWHDYYDRTLKLKDSVQGEIVVENAAFRLTLAEAGHATSLVCKETGEECLAKGVKMPFCTLTQYRPYDNENFLIHPAKPTTYPANRITREGDRLVVEFDGTADVAYIALKIADSYMGFSLERLDFKIEDYGVKRKTETDEFALVRLPIARREHFGEWLNVMWDDRTAVTLLGDAPETRVDAFAREDGAYELYAGMENRVKLEGCGAVLVVSQKGRLLDVIGRVERDYGMPNGAETRQKVGADASFYWTECITPENVERHIAAAKACGLKYLMIYYPTFALTCGHFDFDLKRYPRGLEDLKAVSAKIREAGLTPGLHFHYNKASTNDAYVVDGTTDPRLHGICDLLLARPLAAEDTTIYLQGNPAGIVVEPVAASELAARESARHLVQIGEELIRYQRAVAEPPYRLEGCVRGALGTKPAAHTTAERFRHLNVDDWPIFVRIDQDTDLQDEIAARLAALIGECGFRMYHYDGAEDVPEPYWYNVARAQTRVRRAIGDHQIWARSAAHVQYSWHSITHGCGFDMFPHERLREAVRRYWTKKAFHLAESFTTTDFGSIDVRGPDEMRQYADGTERRTTGMQMDHAELTCSKSIAWDGCSGIRVYREKELEHPLFADICAVMRRWEEVRAAGSVSEAMKQTMRDASREWFIWPFGFDPKRPELVEYRQVTKDEERPLRAFSFTRGGKGGLVYWAVGSDTPPPLAFAAPGIVVREDGARRFVEADIPEAELAAQFRAAHAKIDKSGQDRVNNNNKNKQMEAIE